jgi:hypothetical protein
MLTVRFATGPSALSREAYHQSYHHVHLIENKLLDFGIIYKPRLQRLMRERYRIQ